EHGGTILNIAPNTYESMVLLCVHMRYLLQLSLKLSKWEPRCDAKSRRRDILDAVVRRHRTDRALRRGAVAGDPGQSIRRPAADPQPPAGGLCGATRGNLSAAPADPRAKTLRATRRDRQLHHRRIPDAAGKADAGPVGLSS